MSAPPPVTPPDPHPPAGREEQVRVALRLVLHLGRSGPPDRQGLGRESATQRGIAATLGVTQGAVSKILDGLTAAGVVGRQRTHVPGRDRRVRVYFLTARGEALARVIEQALTRRRG